MIAIVHIITGIAVGKIIKLPILSWILALISHFILDMIPHSEYSTSPYLFNLLSFDLLAGFFILFLIIRKEKSKDILRIFIASLLATLPDNLVFAERFFSGIIISIPLIGEFILNFIKRFSDIHNLIHTTYSPNVFLGILTQIIIISLSFLFIFKKKKEKINIQKEKK